MVCHLGKCYEQITGINRMSAPQGQLSYQQGGMVNSFHVFMMNLDSPAKLIYGFILVLIIVYSPVIPVEYRSFADSLLGRIFGVAIVYGVIETLGWVYGLLTAMAFLLVLNGAPSNYVAGTEGFEGGGTVTEKKIIGRKWFVEQVLGENPKKIATDKVTTTAVET
jgi:hypothetical protein